MEKAARVTEFLRVTFETMDQGITIYDSNFRLVAWNEKYRTLGVFPDEFVKYGSSLFDAYVAVAKLGIFGPGDPHEHAARHIKALRDGPRIEEELLTPPNGKVLRIRRFWLPNGGVCATFADVTKEIQIQEQLRHAAKMDAIGRMVGGVAHDFNNLLAVIVVNLEMALKVNDPARAQSWMRKSLEAADRGSKLTNRLLMFAQRQPLAPKPVDLKSLIPEVVSMLAVLLGATIKIDVGVERDLWLVEVDGAQFEAALINLAINARDAMPEGGSLQITVANADDKTPRLAMQADKRDFVCIRCKDSGEGISAEHLDKIFEPFYTTKSTGNGLGLATVQAFVEQSKGFVDVESKPGTGTEFFLYLPRYLGPESPDDEALGVIASPCGQGRTILLVEDNEELRKALSDELAAEGFIVEEAGDAAQAMDVLDRIGHADLLLSDIVLPGGMNGRDLAEALRLRQPGLKILLMSGYASEPLIERIRTEDRWLVVPKPFRRATILRRVVDVLAEP